MVVIISQKTFLFSVISHNLCSYIVSFTVLCYKDLLNVVFFTWICQIKKVCFSPSVFQIPVINVECNFEKKILITWWKQLNQKPACTNELFHQVIKYLLNDDIIGNCVGWSFWSETMWDRLISANTTTVFLMMLSIRQLPFPLTFSRFYQNHGIMQFYFITTAENYLKAIIRGTIIAT